MIATLSFLAIRSAGTMAADIPDARALGTETERLDWCGVRVEVEQPTDLRVRVGPQPAGIDVALAWEEDGPWGATLDLRVTPAQPVVRFWRRVVWGEGASPHAAVDVTVEPNP